MDKQTNIGENIT